MKAILVLSTFVFLNTNTCFAQKAKYREKFTEANYLFLEENYPLSLSHFLEAYKIDSSNANINYKIGLCYLHSAIDKSKAIPYLQKATGNVTKKYTDFEPREKKAPINSFYFLGLAYHENNRFDEAMVSLEKYISYLGDKQTDLRNEVNRQIETCRNAKELINSPVNVIITPLNDSINSPFPDYSPVVSADESTIIFTSRRPGSTGGDRTPDNQFYEDIYISYKKKDNTWTTPVSIGSSINTIGHEATIGLSADGQQLFIYKDDGGDGNIYVSTLNDDAWTHPVKIGSDINTTAWEPSACITADGNTLYFVSDRKEGFGGRDIWKSVKLPNGQWSLATNLGPMINTAYDEDAPFIHPDGRTLYFSSKGHKSMGGFDVFYSIKNEDKGWFQPVNVGFPINTTEDDLFYVTSPDGKRAYYASTKGVDGDKDLYVINTPDAAEKLLTLIKGFILPEPGQTLPSNIQIVVTNNESGVTEGTYKPLKRNGSFTIIIPPGSDYKISYQLNGTEFFTENVYVPDDAAYKEIEKEIKLKPVSLDISVKKDITTDQTEDKGLAIHDPHTKDPANISIGDPVKKDKSNDGTDENAVEKKSSMKEQSGNLSVGRLNFKAFFKYNQISFEDNDPAFAQFIDNVVTAIKNNQVKVITIAASASQVPTRAFPTNKHLALKRGEIAKKQVIDALKTKGIDESMYTLKVKAYVGGPQYNIDYLTNKPLYEKHQYTKIMAK